MIMMIDSSDSLDFNEESSIRNRILNILKTRQGEIPFERSQGINADLIDDKFSLGILTNNVREALECLGESIEVLSLSVDTAGNDFVIKLVIDIG